MQKSFCNIFAVTPNRLQVLQGKVKVGKELDDQREKHTSRPHAIVDDVKELVIEYIRSLPVLDNHYSRSPVTVDNKYLNCNPSLMIMHRLLVEKHGSTTAQYWLYRKIFMTEFNLKFGQPGSDTCKTCDRY